VEAEVRENKVVGKNQKDIGNLLAESDVNDADIDSPSPKMMHLLLDLLRSERWLLWKASIGQVDNDRDSQSGPRQVGLASYSCSRTLSKPKSATF